MKTIEERAAIVFPYEEGDDWANQVGYIRGATEQKQIDIEKFRQWFTKWWELNEYLPLDVCLKSIDKAMED